MGRPAMFQCLDLKERYGKRYRIDVDPAYYVQYGRNGRTYDPWFYQIQCKHGAIYAHGGAMLGSSTNCRGAVAGRLAALPCVRVVQDGTDGINAVFHVDDFAVVAALLKPRRRR